MTSRFRSTAAVLAAVASIGGVLTGCQGGSSADSGRQSGGAASQVRHYSG